MFQTSMVIDFPGLGSAYAYSMKMAMLKRNLRIYPCVCRSLGVDSEGRMYSRLLDRPPYQVMSFLISDPV